MARSRKKPLRDDLFKHPCNLGLRLAQGPGDDQLLRPADDAATQIDALLDFQAAGGEGAVVYQELRGAASLARAGWIGDAATLQA